MLEKLLVAVLNAVLGYVAMWLNAKKAERLEVKVKQLESAAKVKKIERELAEQLDKDLDGKPKAATPAMWNRGRRAPFVPVVLLFLLLPAGCKYVEGRWPILPLPARPQVEVTQPWSPREEKLVDYSESLENVIQRYNRNATVHNRKHGYED